MSTRQVRTAYLGEDIPIQISYADANGNAVDPDNLDADAGATPDAYITITAPNDTDVVANAAMSRIAAGVFEYVWDSGLNNAGTGQYTISVQTDFSGETSIKKARITLQ